MLVRLGLRCVLVFGLLIGSQVWAEPLEQPRTATRPSGQIPAEGDDTARRLTDARQPGEANEVRQSDEANDTPPAANANSARSEPSAGDRQSANNGAADSAQIAAGESAFNRSCVDCHDAAKSLTKNKSKEQWRATIRRMAAKDGAEVDDGDVEPIATFLASRSGGDAARGKGGEAGEAASVTVFGTISPTWRGGNDNLQNGGFFPDAWVGVSFQNDSAVSGRATACMSCHTEAGEGSRIELVEAAIRLDLVKALGCGPSRAKASVDFGRVVVPFGAFAQQSNPGVYRTVTKPLMYNMGFRVLDSVLGDPVLPMPYADEGVIFNLGGALSENIHVSWDSYLINGLQGTADGVDFDLSRDYVANNTRPTAGTRLAIGNQMLKLGSSFMAGQFTPTGGVGDNADNLYYRIYGVDATLRVEDVLRVQFEYARRDSDRIIENPDPFLTRDHVTGYYIEAEILVARWPDSARRISFLTRYDAQSRDSLAPPPESSLNTGVFTVNRFTYGLNFTLSGGSLLMINHERWSLPDGLGHTDVLGIRWACSF